MKPSRWVIALVGLTILVVVGLALWAYPRMPDPMATHWNLAGQPDGWMPRIWGVLIGPLSVVGVVLLFFGLIPAIEPWRENLQRFWAVYEQAGVALALFLAAVYLVTLLWNLGYPLDLGRVVSVGIGFIFLVMARVLREVRPNWFVGIRTPWTLSSPWVWRRVHEVGAKSMALLGVGFFLAALWPPLMLVALGLTLVWAVGLVVYSYVLYRRRLQEEAG